MKNHPVLSSAVCKAH